MSESPPTYRFLDWRAEPAGNRLRRGDRDVHLTPKAMDVLCRLLAEPGQVVSKRALLDDVWGGQAVTDDALVVTIYELRKALGDRARQPTYVQTVVRRGYRFLPEVAVVQSSETSSRSPMAPASMAPALRVPEANSPAWKRLATPWLAAAAG
ncbi:MAG: transcriptional regulator, partial [Acidobacteriota bacterium]